MKINEELIPAWVLEVISPDKIYQELNSTIYVFHEIVIEYNNNKYRLMFGKYKVNEEDVWSLETIIKRNPQGIWYKIKGE
jgi:hypothetical protein